MPDPFDGYQYFTHLRSRWRVPAVVAGVALTTSLILTLLIPNKYTAAVALIIEPPAGSDARSATVVSPIYLESLKTYEHFASSDALFAQAAERFQLRREQPRRSLESLKHSVLKVEIPRNTKVLKINATLTEARAAHEFARFIAEETIKLNRRTKRAGDDELIAESRQRLEEATRRLAAAEAARNRASRRTPTPEALKMELDQLNAGREEVFRLMASAELSTGGSADKKLETLRRQAAGLGRDIAAKHELLAQRTAEIESANAEYDSASTAREETQRRLLELEATSGTRSEYLTMLDPGIVPEQPSSPNITLNLLAALALALVVSLLYLTLEFGLQSHRTETIRKTLRVTAKT